MTTAVFLDTYALVEMSKDNPSYDKYKQVRFVTSDFNLAELYYVLKRNNYSEAEAYYAFVSRFSMRPNKDSLRKAALMKLNKDKGPKNFSLIGCVGYVLAMDHGILFVTGDKEFEKMENVEFIK